MIVAQNDAGPGGEFRWLRDLSTIDVGGAVFAGDDGYHTWGRGREGRRARGRKEGEEMVNGGGEEGRREKGERGKEGRISRERGKEWKRGERGGRGEK